MRRDRKEVWRTIPGNRAYRDHMHFLVQSIPKLSVSQIVRVNKTITAREIFRRCPEVKKQLWGGGLWIDGYFASTVGVHGNEHAVANYVSQQGIEDEYK